MLTQNGLNCQKYHIKNNNYQIVISRVKMSINKKKISIQFYFSVRKEMHVSFPNSPNIFSKIQICYQKTAILAQKCGKIAKILQVSVYCSVMCRSCWSY